MKDLTKKHWDWTHIFSDILSYTFITGVITEENQRWDICVVYPTINTLGVRIMTRCGNNRRDFFIGIPNRLIMARSIPQIVRDEIMLIGEEVDFSKENFNV